MIRRGLEFGLANGWKIKVYLPEHRRNDINLNRNMANMLWHRHLEPWANIIQSDPSPTNLQWLVRIFKHMVDDNLHVLTPSEIANEGGFACPNNAYFVYFE